MKYLLLLASVITLPLLASENQSTHCTFGDKQRIIEVIYPKDGTKACEVHYTKGSDMQVLWSANHDLDYCKEKAAAFIEKQRGWGWHCGSDNQTMPAHHSMDEKEDLTKSTAEKVSEKVGTVGKSLHEKVKETAKKLDPVK